MKRKIFDSNIWVSYFVEEDSNHKKALKLVGGMDKIYITEYIILEVSSVLTLKLGSGLSKKITKDFLDGDPAILVEYDDIFSETTGLFFSIKEKNKLSFVDISLLALSKKYEIITFDKEIKKFLK